MKATRVGLVQLDGLSRRCHVGDATRWLNESRAV